jgi:hypothetical protein
MIKVLFISRKAEHCGVNDYGKRVNAILQNSTLFDVHFAEIETPTEYVEWYNKVMPEVVLYNYYPTILPFVTDNFIEPIRHIPHVAVYHEVGFGFSPNGIIDIDFTKSDNPDGNFFASPRPLFNYSVEEDLVPNDVPVIGSFGFGFPDKNFPKIAELVCSQFDKALIKLSIPFATFGDAEGNMARTEADKVREVIKKSGNTGIELEVNHNFMEHTDVLNFLRGNDINVFLYDKHESRSLSSTIDYALSVKKPIAISNSAMFRHIQSTTPSICVDDLTLPEIIANGITPLEPFYEQHSNKKLLEKYEYALTTILNRK